MFEKLSRRRSIVRDLVIKVVGSAVIVSTMPAYANAEDRRSSMWSPTNLFHDSSEQNVEDSETWTVIFEFWFRSVSVDGTKIVNSMQTGELGFGKHWGPTIDALSITYWTSHSAIYAMMDERGHDHRYVVERIADQRFVVWFHYESTKDHPPSVMSDCHYHWLKLKQKFPRSLGKVLSIELRTLTAKFSPIVFIPIHGINH